MRRRGQRSRRGLLTGAGAVAGLQAVQSAYLVSLWAAAVLTARRRPSGTPKSASDPDGLRLVILVPAHDEQLSITAAVTSLLECVYDPARREVIVIADNCGDDTGALAADAGATVWERHEPRAPGKGQAVAWALARLERERSQAEAVVMMDADCLADPQLLVALAAPLREGADAVQGAYLGANPEASSAAALRWAGYGLINVVRPAGKTALGLSCGLFGSGMAFPRRTLQVVPWSAFSVTEDKEQHLRLLERGLRVRFAARAVVRTPLPVDRTRGQTQQVRWESGNLVLARRWVPRLLRRALSTGDLHALHGAFELMLPPLSLLVAPLPVTAILGRLLGSRALMLSSALSGLSLSAYVVGGLRFAQAPASVFRALASAPVLIAGRVGQYRTLVRGGGHNEWQRTSRG